MEEQKEIVAEYIKCESCGANMLFNPTTQMLYCESCGTQKDFEKDRQVQELAISEAFSSEEIFDKAGGMKPPFREKLRKTVSKLVNEKKSTLICVTI